MKDVNFGLGTELADTDQKEPAIAMHGSNVLATWGQGDKLRYRLGKAVSSTVAWSPDGPLTDGVQSSCALVHNSEGQAGNLFGALVYKSDSNADQLSARAGRAEGRTITWGDATTFGKGQFPALAVNDGLYAVVAFRESDPSFVLRYRVGFLSIVRGERGITFADDAAGTLLGTGDRPAVAINGARQAIFVWQTNTNPPHLNYRVGTVANNHISGLGPVRRRAGRPRSVGGAGRRRHRDPDLPRPEQRAAPAGRPAGPPANIPVVGSPRCSSTGAAGWRWPPIRARPSRSTSRRTRIGSPIRPRC